MLFNSIQFLIFFPVVCIVHYLLPHKIRYIYLLICSYYFYMCWDPEYALLLLTSTVITYTSGLFISSAKEKNEGGGKHDLRRLYVALSFTSNLLILFFFKYYGFAGNTLTRLFSVLHVNLTLPQFDVVLPVGISFYTFQALSYTMDVYRGEVKAEKNFLKYALFVSFFPQLVAGPIERSKNLLKQIDEKHKFDWERIRDGLLLMLYGYFLKVVLSAYLAMAVDNVYDNLELRTGYQILIATVCFSFQIYCDFAGYSNIAIGAAQVLGFRLMENFDTPYLSRTVAEFWRRWHISLTTWFRDYLYIPLGGNRKGKIRKWINCMIVFLVSGLWHGASWHFVVWGGLNGLYQIVGEWTLPLRKKVSDILKIDTEVASHKLLQMLITFVFVNTGWIFFRAEAVSQAFYVIKRILNVFEDGWFTWGQNLEFLGWGLTEQKRDVVLVSLGILLFADICKYRGFRIRSWISKQGKWLQWLIYYLAIFGILIFGIYGPDFDKQAFIYFQF